MPRNWKTKTNRIRSHPETIKEAVSEVLTKNISLRSVAQSFNISKSTLARYVAIAKQSSDLASFVPAPNVGNRKIFSNDEENELCNYLKLSSQMCYGLTTAQTKTLAYNYAQFLGKVPSSWEENKTAGREWLFGFMARHKDLSIRTPEATSQSRLSSFNKNNVDLFFRKLEEVLNRYKFEPENIFNCDETGLSTVTDPPKVISTRGIKQVGQVSSAERGQLVTMLNFINATGNTIPPVYVFPRVHFKDFMLEDCPPGSLGLAHQSGWMTADNFFQAMEHFVKHIKCTKEKPVLLLMDNHESHINIRTISLAKEQGVVILTFPPHCSHRLQPLDVSLYAPFKIKYRIAQNNWLTSHPGKTITIYNVASLSKIAYFAAFTKSNIINGFQRTGIYPLNTEIFSEEDLLPSSVTDRPLINETSNEDNVPSTSTSSYAASLEETTGLVESFNNSPLTFIRPYPKASARKSDVRRKRKRGSCRVLTDTPEKQALQEEENSRAFRKLPKKKGKRLNFSTTKPLDDDIDSSDKSETMSLHDESDSSMEENADLQTLTLDDISEDDFILIKLCGKKTILHYVARVLSKTKNNIQVQYLKKKDNVSLFYYNEKPDIYFIDLEDILMKLPKPRALGTARTQGLLSFDVNLSQYIS